jgi:hypothetical protein
MTTSRRSRAILVSVSAVSGTVLTLMPPGNAAASQTHADTSLAGHHWRHQVQVDGKAGRDTVLITGGKDLRLDSFGMGTGHIRVRVQLANGRRIQSSRQFISYFSVRQPWTPWVGATNLDHRGGKEILLGFSTGAHTQLFTSLTYRAGRLRPLHAPGSSSWMVNSSVGTGSSGWRCTDTGVQGRSVTPDAVPASTFRIQRNSYVKGARGWVRTGHFVTTVAADADGNPPASTNDYPTFNCPGLPRSLL